VVTGAGNGIGKTTSLLLAREGARVLVTDIDEAAAAAVASQVSAISEGAYRKHDVCSESEWEAVTDDVLARFGRLDILVNNAGVGTPGNAEETTFEAWRSVMSVNSDGVFLGVRRGIAAMKAFGGGSIVNLSSIYGLVGESYAAAYSASKGAVRLLTKSAALYCASAGYKIRVNSVHPGYVLTAMVQAYLDQAPEGADVARKTLEARHPLGVLGTPDDIAYAILYLAADESKFVTGAELVIDGGFSAQ
jgi:NAD(P)-dependent dehydrogenase (short-subunit alcohol dehydrogenase family)